MEELGELSHAHLKMEQGIRGEFATHQLGKQDAVGDIIIYLADYCDQNGLDLQKCVEYAWGQVKNRDWVKNSLDGAGGELVAVARLNSAWEWSELNSEP